MSQELAMLVDATVIAYDYNNANPKDVIRIEALMRGVRIWIVFEASNGKNYTHENLTPWRALHQKRSVSVTSPLATAIGSLIQKRDEFIP